MDTRPEILAGLLLQIAQDVVWVCLPEVLGTYGGWVQEGWTPEPWNAPHPPVEPVLATK